MARDESRFIFFLPHNLMSTDLELMFTVFKLMSIALELMFTACKHKFSRYRDTFFLVIANNRIKSPKQPKSHQIICVIQYFSVFLQTNEIINLKPSCVQRQLIGEILNRFERRGLRVAGMKMMQLSDEILREHYAHLVDKPFFPSLAASMQASPVVALALEGVDAVQVVRTMTGSTNGREAAPGTIRGDYSMSNQQNIVHASDSTSNAEIELRRFFKDEEIFDYQSGAFGYIYGSGEAK